MSNVKSDAMVFCTGENNEIEWLRIEPNGDAYVRGNLVANDIDVYEGFVAWLKGTQKERVC